MHGSLAQNTKTKQKKEVLLLQTMMSQYATCDDCVKAKGEKRMQWPNTALVFHVKSLKMCFLLHYLWKEHLFYI